MGKAGALRPTLALFRQALKSGVHVFFITGRYEDNKIAAAPMMRDATAANLDAVGYSGYTCLFLQPNDAPSWNCTDVAKPTDYLNKYSSTGEYKAAVRKAIAAAGYTIILNLGDQPSDLGTTADWSKDPAEASFLLPNPFY